MGEVQPQDADSGLVKWTARRPQRGKPAITTGKTLEGQQVEATWMDRQGHVRHAAGTVVRNRKGELAIEHMADGQRRWSTVTRDANVDVKSR